MGAAQTLVVRLAGVRQIAADEINPFVHIVLCDNFASHAVSGCHCVQQCSGLGIVAEQSGDIVPFRLPQCIGTVIGDKVAEAVITKAILLSVCIIIQKFIFF